MWGTGKCSRGVWWLSGNGSTARGCEGMDAVDLGELRAQDFGYLDAEGHTYLDYTGAGLAPTSLVRASAERITGGVFGNPHSESPASRASGDLLAGARAAVLRHFSADPRRVRGGVHRERDGRAAPDRRVVPVRPRRPARHAPRQPQLRERPARVRPRGRRQDRVCSRPGAGVGDRRGPPAHRPHGPQAPPRTPRLSRTVQLHRRTALLDWIGTAQEHGYDVLLDAAASVPTNPLDLSRHHPDFTVLSWYKVFGYPTGIGSLIVRREALARLARPGSPAARSTPPAPRHSGTSSPTARPPSRTAPSTSSPSPTSRPGWSGSTPSAWTASTPT